MSTTIRIAQDNDVSAITALVNHYAEQNITLPRTEEDVRQTLDDWVVVVESQPTPESKEPDFDGGEQLASGHFTSEQLADEQLVGCGCLIALSDELAEVRSLAIASGQQGKGLGAKIVRQLVEMAKARQYKQVCALTLTEGFFLKLGFELVDRWSISPKVWQACIYCPKFHRCDEVAVLMTLDPNMKTSGMHPDQNAEATAHMMPQLISSRQPAWTGLLKWQAWQPLKLAYQKDKQEQE